MATVKSATGTWMRMAPKRHNKFSTLSSGKMTCPDQTLNPPLIQRRTLRGFTLIELLIVIVIISVVSSVALLTISHNQNKDIENFAHRLVQVITLAEHEAMLRPATLGLGFTGTTYQFYNYKPSSKWQPIDDKNLSSHSIPNNVQITLKMNEKTIALDGKPVIIISESSDITPFIILLSEPNKRPVYQVTGDANGNIKSEPAHEE